MRLWVGVCRLDSDGHAVLGEDPVDPGVGQQFRSGVGSVLQIGPHRALFGAGLIAHPAVPDQVGVVFVRVDVQRGDPIRATELGRTLPQPLVRAILSGDLVVAFDPVEHRLEVFIERRGVDVLKAEVGSPAGADGVGGEQRVRPVDGAATAHGAARGDADHAVGGGKEATPQEQVLICRQFGLLEVGFVVVAAGLEDDHPLAGFRQQRGGHSAAAAGADDDDIRLERGLTGRGDDLQRLAGIRRRGLGRRPDTPCRPTADCGHPAREGE